MVYRSRCELLWPRERRARDKGSLQGTPLTEGLTMSAMNEKTSLAFFYGFHALEIAALAVGFAGILTLLLW